ncbi:hypothetical protein [Bacteroides ihuae]|nr:hypothetical protein [Bacteroides ihuae]
MTHLTTFTGVTEVKHKHGKVMMGYSYIDVKEDRVSNKYFIVLREISRML